MRWCLLATLIVLPACAWSGWKLQGVQQGSAWGASVTGGVIGGAVCAEWAYQRGDPKVCGKGTKEVDGKCIGVAKVSCGPGTMELNHQCVVMAVDAGVAEDAGLRAKEEAPVP